MKILCIQLRQMGDVIMTTPATRQLRELYPDAEIVFMTEPLGANVYKNNPFVSRVWVVKRKPSLRETLSLMLAIRREKFDLVIDFFSNPKSAQLTFASGAKRRLGFDFRGRHYAYTDPVAIPPEIMYAAQAKNCLVHHLGGRIDDNKILFPLDPEGETYADAFAQKYGFAEGKTVAFCVVSRRQYRLWQPEKWAAVAERIAADGYRLFFVYGPGEEAMAHAVYDRLSDPAAAIIDYEMPDIQQLRSLIGRCCAYVGNDGGSKHLSICAGIPTLTLFYDNGENWTPPEGEGFNLFRQASEEMTVEEVLGLYDELKAHL